MAISGKLVLEDTTIEFTLEQLGSTPSIAHVKVTDAWSNTSESYIHDGAEFMAALAIAVHNDGTPDYVKDYPAAERAQRKFRWIR